MFGQLKESILSNLEETYKNNGEKDFKQSFAKYVKVLKFWINNQEGWWKE